MSKIFAGLSAVIVIWALYVIGPAFLLGQEGHVQYNYINGGTLETITFSRDQVVNFDGAVGDIALTAYDEIEGNKYLLLVNGGTWISGTTEELTAKLAEIDELKTIKFVESQITGDPRLMLLASTEEVYETPVMKTRVIYTAATISNMWNYRSGFHLVMLVAGFVVFVVSLFITLTEPAARK